MYSQNSPARQAFTLIELLTVIAIIAILMALLFPALNGAKEQGRKASAGVAVQGIVSAVKQYYTEYGKFPDMADPNKPPSGGNTDSAVGDEAAAMSGKPNRLLFDTLRAIPEGANAAHVGNPRKIPFFDGKRASNAADPKDGFQDNTTGADAAKLRCFFDPWGSQYNVIVDNSGDNLIDVGTYYSDFADPNLPRTQVGSFSLGKDKQLGEKGNNQFRLNNVKSDDIISWQ